MKKFIFGVVCLVCTVSCFAGNDSIIESKRYGVVDKTLYGTEWEREVNNLYKRADYYKNKASAESNAEISAVYLKCADAKEKIAEGYNTVYSSNQKSINLFDSSPEIKKAIANNDLNDCVLGKKKGMRYNTYLSRLKKYSEICMNNAKKADKAGKIDLGKQFREAASYMNAKYNGLKLVLSGQKDFKVARKDFKDIAQRSKV